VGRVWLFVILAFFGVAAFGVLIVGYLFNMIM
jgi:hypothetical protein